MDKGMNLSAFEDQGFVSVVNTSGRTLKFDIAERAGRVRKYAIKPGQTTMVEKGYLLRVETGNGTIRPSVLDRKTGVHNGSSRFDANKKPVLVPVDSEQGAKFVASQEVAVAEAKAKAEAKEPEKKTVAAPTVEVQVMEALEALDPLNDDDWTTSGLPSMDSVKALVGDDITRAQLNELAPDFIRPVTSSDEFEVSQG